MVRSSVSSPVCTFTKNNTYHILSHLRTKSLPGAHGWVLLTRCRRRTRARRRGRSWRRASASASVALATSWRWRRRSERRVERGGRSDVRSRPSLIVHPPNDYHQHNSRASSSSKSIGALPHALLLLPRGVLFPPPPRPPMADHSLPLTTHRTNPVSLPATRAFV